MLIMALLPPLPTPITLMMFCDLSLVDCPSVNAKGIVFFVSMVIRFLFVASKIMVFFGN